MYQELLNKLRTTNTKLVAVSKTKPLEAIMELYNQGHRDFGENKVQELVEKYESLPKDINWHFIGHLQTNKVKYIAPFVHMIHAIDSLKLLKEINKQATKADRTINCLLQFKIAKEDSKYGLDFSTASDILQSETFLHSKHINISGVMGMATYTDDKTQVKEEFQTLRQYFDELKASNFSQQPSFKEISMGMSGDFEIAQEQGSTMVRIGSLLFGARVYAQTQKKVMVTTG